MLSIVSYCIASIASIVSYNVQAVTSAELMTSMHYDGHVTKENVLDHYQIRVKYKVMNSKAIARGLACDLHVDFQRV